MGVVMYRRQRKTTEAAEWTRQHMNRVSSNRRETGTRTAQQHNGYGREINARNNKRTDGRTDAATGGPTHEGPRRRKDETA